MKEKKWIVFVYHDNTLNYVCANEYIGRQALNSGLVVDYSIFDTEAEAIEAIEDIKRLNL